MDVTRHTDEHLDLCAGYALRSLDPHDQKRFMSHLATGCRECEAGFDHFGAAALVVAHAAPVTLPSPGLRDKVLSDAMLAHGGRAPEAAGPPARRPWVTLLVFALIMVAAVILFEVMRLR